MFQSLIDEKVKKVPSEFELRHYKKLSNLKIKINHQNIITTKNVKTSNNSCQ